MKTRITTAAVALLACTFAVTGCVTEAADDAAPSTTKVTSIGYGNYAPRGQAAEPAACLDDVHSRTCHLEQLKNRPDGGPGFTWPSRVCLDDAHSRTCHLEALKEANRGGRH